MLRYSSWHKDPTSPICGPQLCVMHERERATERERGREKVAVVHKQCGLKYLLKKPHFARSYPQSREEKCLWHVSRKDWKEEKMPPCKLIFLQHGARCLWRRSAETGLKHCHENGSKSRANVKLLVASDEEKATVDVTSVPALARRHVGERRRFWWDQKWALLAAMLYAIFAVRQTLHPAHILPNVEHGGGSIMQGKCGEQSATFCKRNDLGLYFYFPAICGCVHTKLFKPVIYVICGLIHWATHTHPSCTMYYYEIKG